MIGRIIGFLVVALIAGFGGRALMPGNDNMSTKHTLMLGGAGSLIGTLLGAFVPGKGPYGSIIGAIIGSVIALFVWKKYGAAFLKKNQ
jgi:uncharacterized membrane protein YeaQ/YmgE (transglycosylase-associated protein family)